MANVRLDRLPPELIAHIAKCSNAYSVLQLAATCHKIREACYDPLVFKKIIQTSQAAYWQIDCLDIAAIERRCGKNVAAWAHYALADDLTVQYAQELQTNPVASALDPVREAAKPPNMSWSTWAAEARVEGERGLIMTWLPELFISRHPFMLDSFWQKFLNKRPTILDNRHMFCLIMAILAWSESGDATLLDMERKLASPAHQQKLIQGETMNSCLWSLAWTIIQIRQVVKNRASVWPFNDSARVPHTPPPNVRDIPLLPLAGGDMEKYDIPLPLSTDFDDWYKAHTEAMAAEEHITSGVWQGYYTYYHSMDIPVVAARQFDPPMKNIRFTRNFEQHGVEPLDLSASDSVPLRLAAENGYDGHDEFTVRGTVTKRGDDIVFRGVKRYVHNMLSWDWDLRMTPFGLVGFWGRQRGQSSWRNGSLWLWKVDDRKDVGSLTQLSDRLAEVL